jgi:hypothetical protein
MPPAPLAAVITTGVLVTGGAAAMSFLAVAMSSGGADRSDDQSPAVGATTIYGFLLVGGLFNLVLTGGGATRAAGLLLYLFTLAAYWADGVERAEICFDAEAIRAPRLRAADGATLALIAALVGRGVASVAAGARGPALAAVLGLGLGVRLALAAVGLRLLHQAGAPPRGGRWTLALAATAGVFVGWASTRIAPPGIGPAVSVLPAAWAGVVLAALADEIIWRGVLQGSVERALAGRVGGDGRAPLLAAVVTLGLSAGALVLAGGASRPALTAAVVATAARAVSGRLSGALAGRTALALTRLAMGVFP